MTTEKDIDDEGAPDVPDDPVPSDNDGDGEPASGTEPTDRED